MFGQASSVRRMGNGCAGSSRRAIHAYSNPDIEVLAPNVDGEDERRPKLNPLIGAGSRNQHLVFMQLRLSLFLQTNCFLPVISCHSRSGDSEPIVLDANIETLGEVDQRQSQDRWWNNTPCQSCLEGPPTSCQGSMCWMSMMAPGMGPSWLSYVSTSFWRGICGPGCRWCESPASMPWSLSHHLQPGPHIPLQKLVETLGESQRRAWCFAELSHRFQCRCCFSTRIDVLDRSRK